ncbi:hypothetical protein M8J75_011334 [Diaphorina citri]|nr:hypothetical protein M8J75_011334 [Diaphorina citri]
MSFLNLSLVLCVLLCCGYTLSAPLNEEKEELKLSDPAVQEALQVAYTELGKSSDDREKRLKASSVKRAEVPGGSGKGYEFKMYEDRDCSKIPWDAPGACIHCNVFVYDKPNETPRFTMPRMDCIG